MKSILAFFRRLFRRVEDDVDSILAPMTRTIDSVVAELERHSEQKLHDAAEASEEANRLLTESGEARAAANRADAVIRNLKTKRDDLVGLLGL